ncbi:hypothetical protein PoB_003393600 [Plakobranchus ocellatus]|uniref:Secreted protein n=1 Tax=Plakobranchus ocellatus TaxID=259542 RepID=A0AAV4AGL3_9GAST|nr:hypothetical protein PoB_003393600 [Plakobranchus ocellatus]
MFYALGLGVGRLQRRHLDPGFVWFLCIFNRGTDDGAQTRDRRITADLTADSLFTVPPTPRTIMRLAFCLWKRERGQTTQSMPCILVHEKCQFQAGFQLMALGICAEFMHLKQLLQFRIFPQVSCTLCLSIEFSRTL